jgi:hypothetical protein
MKRLLSVLVVIHALSGCVTGERMQSVREGMWKDEVVSILGNPDESQRVGNYEVLRYTNRLIGGGSRDRTDYNVILRGGRVVQYGPGQVRQRDPNTGTLVIVPVR